MRAVHGLHMRLVCRPFFIGGGFPMNVFRIVLSAFVGLQMVVFIAFGIVQGDSPAQKKGWVLVVTTYALCLMGMWLW